MHSCSDHLVCVWLAAKPRDNWISLTPCLTDYILYVIQFTWLVHNFMYCVLYVSLCLYNTVNTNQYFPLHFGERQNCHSISSLHDSYLSALSLSNGVLQIGISRSPLSSPTVLVPVLFLSPQISSCFNIVYWIQLTLLLSASTVSSSRSIQFTFLFRTHYSSVLFS